MSYSSSLRFHDSSYFTQKMLLCITDLCNSGVFHSELRHGCGGNEGFTSWVSRNLWEEKKMKFTKFSGKPWVYTRTLMTPLSTAPPWNNPSSCHFTSTKKHHYFDWFREGVWQNCFWLLCAFQLNNLMGVFLLRQKWHMLLFTTS